MEMNPVMSLLVKLIRESEWRTMTRL